MLSELKLTNTIRPNDEYLVSRIEPLHLFHIEISETLNVRPVKYFESGERQMNSSGSKRGARMQNPSKAQLLHGCNSSLAAYKRFFAMSSRQMDFSTKTNPGLMSGFVATAGIK